MNKYIEIHEYDSLIRNQKNISVPPGYQTVDSFDFDYLRRFIGEFHATDENNDVLDFLSIGFKRGIGNTITAKNYVGLIQLQNGFKLQILPKIDFANESDSKKIFLKMLCSLKDFPCKDFGMANLNIKQISIFEVFITMFVREVQNLVKYGLKSNYITKEDNLNLLKGKLLVNQHIKNNFCHCERFYLAYDEFIQNIPENKLVKTTLLKLLRLTTYEKNNKYIRQLLPFFDNIENSDNYEKDFSKVGINRNNREYEVILQWVRIFLLNHSFSTFSGNSTALSLLFPMEKLFESYIAQQLKKVIGECGWKWRVTTQECGYYLFVNPKRCAIKPDIVLRYNANSKKTIVLDTKWKRLNPLRPDYGISRADFYQMYAYSKAYKADVWLLYPQTEDTKKIANSNDLIFNIDENYRLSVFFVDVARIEESLKNLLLCCES